MSNYDSRDKYLDLARTLLLVDEDNNDLVLQYLDVLTNGLPPNKKAKKKVVIVGAGIAGLLAGSLLKAAGHEIKIIEANPERIGGRIKTFHSADPREQELYNPDKEQPFEDPKQYGEAGAMRIPSFHPLVLTLIDKLKLKRRLFFNVSVSDPLALKAKDGKITPVPPATYEMYLTAAEVKAAKEEERFLKPKVWKSPYTPKYNYRNPGQVNNTFIDVNGLQVRKNTYSTDHPDVLEAINESFWMENTTETTSKILNDALDRIRDHINKPAIEDKINGWAYIIKHFDKHSMWSFMKDFAGMSDEEIEGIGTVENLTSRLALSFFHSFLGRSDINPDVTYWELEDGTWTLPYAFIRKNKKLGKGLANLELGKDIIVNRRMVRIEYEHTERDTMHLSNLRDSESNVWIKTVNEEELSEGSGMDDQTTYTGDYALITIPFSSLRHVQVAPAFSYKKRRAIMELHYDAATKVLLEFSERWWEMDEAEFNKALEKRKKALLAEAMSSRTKKASKVTSRNVDADSDVEYLLPWLQNKEAQAFYESAKQEVAVNARSVGKTAEERQAMFGGGNVTDNPNRFTYFPAHKIEGSEGGVILSSYSWSDDARRWDSMIITERYLFALRNMEAIFGEDIKYFYTGRGQTESWANDPYAFGEAAVFTPGQLSAFHSDIPTPEDTVYFAGEHVSLKHAWIEGSLETAIQAALDIHNR